MNLRTMNRQLCLGLSVALVLVAVSPIAYGETLWDIVVPSRDFLDKAAPSRAGEIPVSMFVIGFYVLYLGIIWAFNLAMLRGLRRLPADNVRTARHVAIANTLLAAGDTAMFLAWGAIYFADPQLTGLLDSHTKLPLVILGVFSTSLTMSCYYLYIGFYYRDKFADGRHTIFVSLIIAFFVARLLLHYNPLNIWLSMMLPPGTPNESAWLRNIPLFIYGLLAVLLVLFLAVRAIKLSSDARRRKMFVAIIFAMLALVVSFVFYAIDIFFGHKIPHSFIWITYTVKTIAYVVALILLWYAEFYIPGSAESNAEPIAA